MEHQTIHIKSWLINYKHSSVNIALVFFLVTILGQYHILLMGEVMYKEIVTKAVIGKGKKTFRDKYELIAGEAVDTILGCWVINHKVFGRSENDEVVIEGNFDVNVWYSYDNNTKTTVEVRNVSYNEKVKVHMLEDNSLTSESEILLTTIKVPTVIDVNVNSNIITYEIEKEIGIEIIGDTKVKIAVMENDNTFEDTTEELTDKELDSIIDNEINENYLQ